MTLDTYGTAPGCVIRPRYALLSGEVRRIQQSVITPSFDSSSVSKRGGRFAADNCRGLVDQQVILQRGDHEECIVYAPRDIALENEIANVPTPYG